MGSPVVANDIQLLSEQARICDRLKSLLAVPGQFKEFLDWILDDSGEMSDEAVVSLQDRMSPIGMLVAWAADTLPSNRWLICNGQPVSRTTYATLFQRIGTRYGAGDGSTTFNLPNFQGRTAIGVSSTYTLGQNYGAETVSFQTPTHRHYFGSLAPSNDDVYLFTETDNDAGPATNAILVSGSDSSGNPKSAFMSTQSTVALFTQDPIAVADTDPGYAASLVTISVIQPSVAVHWIIKAL